MAKRQKKDHRSSDLSRRQGVREIKQSFLIVCEGEKTEPDYFKAFRMTAATVKAVGQAMNTMTLVSKAISIREADQKRKKVYDQCWVVFDKAKKIETTKYITIKQTNKYHNAQVCFKFHRYYGHRYPIPPTPDIPSAAFPSGYWHSRQNPGNRLSSSWGIVR